MPASNVSQSMRRCPRCKTIGRLYKSHARNGFERTVEAFTKSIITKYRCHQCNWRGYMFKKFKQQSRLSFYVMLAMFAFGVVVAILMIPQFLLRFVATFLD